MALQESIASFIPPSKEKGVMVMVCGPPGFMESISGGGLGLGGV